MLMIGAEDSQQNSEGEINTPDVTGEAGPSLVENGISILSCPLYYQEPLGDSMIKVDRDIHIFLALLLFRNKQFFI